MKVSALGEFGLIELLHKMTAEAGCQALGPERPLIGIGDDTAAWKCDSSIQLATVDTMVQGVHFSPATAAWREIGWKSLAINLSDIAAMGGVPEYVLIALALPENTDTEDVTGLYRGIIESAKETGVAIVGGNVSRAPVVSVTVTVFGRSLNGTILRRDTARPGDAVAVTGYAGSAAGGLEMLTRGLKLPSEDAQYLRKAFVWPIPRIQEGQLLVNNDIMTAIDTSDGLLADLQHICEASRVGARIGVVRLPLHPALTRNFGDRALELALGGGEDYELLFTGEPAKVKSIAGKLSCPLTVIGEITPGSPGQIEVVDSGGKLIEIEKTGWKHF